MGKVIVYSMVSVDGYFEGKENDISWHRIDKEVNDYNVHQLKEAGTLLFGRKTYQLMEGFWPTEKAMAADPEIAKMMNDCSKIVVTKTLKNVSWNNTVIMNDPVWESLDRLKSSSKKDILIFGSGILCKMLIEKEFIDQFRLMINPMVLGEGRSMFENNKIDLQLLKTRIFGNGNILCQYIKKSTF